MKTKFIKICQRLASYSDHDQHKMAAVIIKKNKLLGLGFNVLKTSPKSKHEFKQIHAEFSAMKRLTAEELEGSTIFVFREKRDGTPANAKPCESCLALIIKSGIKKIYYTHETGTKLIML